MPNPFFYGGRIENQDFFVGREAELRRIFSALETNHTGQLQHYSIVAPRRMGKSSLLYHVTQIFSGRLRNPENYRFVYIDLDDAHCHTQAGLLAHILDKLELSHPRLPSLEGFQERIEREQARKIFWTVLCLDEFEHLTRRKGEFPDAFFDAWRSLGANNQLAFLTASKTPLDKLAGQGDLTSPFFNIFQILELGEFTETEAQTLVARGLDCDRPFTSHESAQVLKLAGRHPAKLQIATQELYFAKGSGSAVDFRAWQRAYQRQVRHIFGEQPSRWPKALIWLRQALYFVFIGIPQALGRFIMELLKREKFSESTAWLLGVIAMTALILLLLGIFSLDGVQVWIAEWVCTFNPRDCQP